MAEHDVLPLKADNTSSDPVINKWLSHYGRAGVPFYLVIPADQCQPFIELGEVITPGLVKDALVKGNISKEVSKTN